MKDNKNKTKSALNCPHCLYDFMEGFTVPEMLLFLRAKYLQKKTLIKCVNCKHEFKTMDLLLHFKKINGVP